MRSDLLLANASLQSQGGRMLVIEAMMGLFDGAADGSGSAGDLAGLLGLPVILVIDCSGMSHSVAALARGFANFHPDVLVPGVILNHVASPRHEGMLRQALENARVEVLGALPRNEKLVLPERHLGLVQASENEKLAELIDDAADVMESQIDLDKLIRLAHRAHTKPAPANIPRLPPPGQKVAVARDVAFAFAYEHMLLGWRRRGAELSFFSPLEGEGPAADCDAVVLSGGYPELARGQDRKGQRLQGGHEGGDRSRRSGLWRVWRLHGARRGADRCGGCPPRDAWRPAAGHQFCRSQAASGLSPADADAGLLLGHGTFRTRIPLCLGGLGRRGGSSGSLRRVMRWAPTSGMQDCAAAMWRDPSCM
jgi:hypothetical protein